MTLSVSGRQRRVAGVAILEVIGFLLLAVHIHNIWSDVMFKGEGIHTALLEFAFPGTLIVLFMYAGWYLWRSDTEDHHIFHIAQWSGVAILGALALLAWALGIQLIVSNGTEPYILTTNSALIAAIGGLMVGIYSVKQSKQQAKLEESEERYRSLTEDVLDSSDVGIFILDDDYQVVWLNEATERYFGLDRDAVVGNDMRQLVMDHLQHRVEEPDRFRNRILSSYSDSESERFELHVTPSTGREERWLEHRSQPIESGLYEGGRIEHYSDITEQTHTRDVLEQRETILRGLLDIFLEPGRDTETEVVELLETCRDAIDVDHAMFMRVDDGAYEVALSADSETFPEGATFDPSETYTELVETTEATCQYDDIGEEHPELANRLWYTEYGMEYYIGVPIFVQDSLHGTLCFLDESGRRADGWEITLFQIMANWVGYELEQERRERERERELRETREEFTSLVDDIEDYSIFRLDTEGYVTSWNRGAREDIGYERPEILDKHLSTFFDDEAVAEAKPQQLLREATSQGRVETEGWLQRKDGERFWASIAISALRDDDGDLRGFMQIVRDMTDRKLREQELEHERQRLEFINRLIRHNLLNNLNVVQARMDLIDGDTEDDEVATHMNTIKERTEEMADLIETMRSFMRVIVEHEDTDLEPIALDSVIRNEVLKAETDYGHATFEIGALPNVQVLGDTLLPELFVNLLSNAVEHNDKDDPHVIVDVETTEEEAVVRIADNGPGVPDHIKEDVFEKGQKRYNSPGTGFGLYLVKELVDAYEGSIEVAENDPEGAVFTVRLPLASVTTEEAATPTEVPDAKIS